VAHFFLLQNNFAPGDFMDIPTLAAIFIASGQTLKNIDVNETGADDFAGTIVEYVGDAALAISEGDDLPEMPEVILHGTKEKIGKAARGTLMMVQTFLPFIMVKVGSRYRAAIKYFGQVIQQLLAEKPVPPLPTEVKASLR
jgi:hypothetical protein